MTSISKAVRSLGTFDQILDNEYPCIFISASVPVVSAYSPSISPLSCIWKIFVVSWNNSSHIELTMVQSVSLCLLTTKCESEHLWWIKPPVPLYRVIMSAWLLHDSMIYHLPASPPPPDAYPWGGSGGPAGVAPGDVLHQCQGGRALQQLQGTFQHHLLSQL